MNRIQMGILFFFMAVACLLLFVLGWKRGRGAGFRTRLAIAVSILGLMFSEAFAQDNPPPAKPQQGQNGRQKDETETAVSEMVRTQEFKDLRGIWRKIQKALKTVDAKDDFDKREVVLKMLPSEAFKVWKAELEKTILAGAAEAATGPQKTVAAHAADFMLLADVTESIFKHREMVGVVCYEPSAMEPKGARNKDLQAKLLEQQVKDGKVSEETAAKVRRAMNNLYDRTLLPGRELSEGDAMRLSRLLAELNAKTFVDVANLSPELKQKIDGLVAKLGADDFAVREGASKALLEIGDPALPALREALNSKDPEVGLRVKALLDELE